MLFYIKVSFNNQTKHLKSLLVIVGFHEWLSFTVYRSLQELLDYEGGDVEETFLLNFSVGFINFLSGFCNECYMKCYSGFVWISHDHLIISSKDANLSNMLLHFEKSEITG